MLPVLTANLLRDGIPSETLARVDKACHPVAYGTTNSRSVLGSMNDLVQISKDMVSLQRQDILSEIAQLNHKLNRIPMRALKMVHAVREIRTVLNVGDCRDRAEPFLQERVMEPRKIYVELKMSGREKTMILDDALNDLGLDGRFEKSPAGKYFVARLNHDELEDLVDFTAGLANHSEDAEVERELEGYYEKYHDLLLSME